MQELTMELTIGEVVQIGDHTLTVVDISDEGICFDLEREQPFITKEVHEFEEWPNF